MIISIKGIVIREYCGIDVGIKDLGAGTCSFAMTVRQLKKSFIYPLAMFDAFLTGHAGERQRNEMGWNVKG